ncbi:MAG: hypothetical protein EA412_08225 [Chitinophagaceae bacterium]|nr:MAG: hypothetical protein EA412_08225 [Chitinophagaceae bacterium]
MLKKILIFLCLLFQLLTLLCLSGSLISPQHIAISDLLYFAFPYLLFPAIISSLIVVFLSTKSHFKIAAFLMLFLFLAQSRFFISVNLSGSVQKSENAIKVMSYNVNNFGLYSWDMNIEIRDSIMAFIKSEDPDILFFQDFFTTFDGALNNIAYLQDKLNYNHFAFSPTLTNRKGHQWGLAVFSRFPLEKELFVPFQSTKKEANTNGLQILNAQINTNEKIYLFNYHLESYKLGSRFQLDANQNYRKVNWWFKNMKPIILHMLPSMKEKMKQAKIVSNHLDQKKYPVIAAGDMNDIPGSSTYTTIHNKLYDTALSGNSFFPYTIKSFPPFFRIDYISSSLEWQIVDYKVKKIKYSDHYPIVSTLQLK